MEFFTQQLVNGITLGSLYALLAIGYSIVYGVIGLLNFAQGEVYMIGAFIGLFVLTWLGGPGALTVPVALALVLMFAAAALGSGVLGVLIERVAFRPLRDSSRMAPLITALGVSIFLQNSVLLLLGPDIRNYESSSYIPVTSGIHVGPLRISLVRILVIVTAVVLMILLTLFVKRTNLGRAMRSVSHDREAAAMMGVDIDRTIMSAFFIGSLLAGVAGVMAGLVFGRVFQLMGFVAGLKAFTGAVIGGIGSIPGAMLGGMLVGLAESFTSAYISSTFQNVIVFCVLIVFMLFRPRGLFGKPEIGKV
jgi:branched-chain amino acid transport system permease protein